MNLANRSLLAASFLLAAIFAVLPATAHSQAYNSQWYGSDGFPDQDCPWVLNDTASPEDPVLSGDDLELVTSDLSEAMYYSQEAAELNVPDPFIIEARLIVDDQFHVAGDARRGVQIGFTVADQRYNHLMIDRDEIFLWNAFGRQGATASVDTDDAFHTYRIEVHGGTDIEVYYDGNLTLTGSILAHSTRPGPMLVWGDTTQQASGSSRWSWVLHNANETTCPESVSVTRTSWGAAKAAFRD